MEALQACRTVKAVSSFLGLSWDTVQAIQVEFRWFRRHVYPTSAEHFFSQCYA